MSARQEVARSMRRGAMNAAQQITRALRRRERYRLLRSIAEQLLLAVQFILAAALVYALLVLGLAL